MSYNTFRPERWATFFISYFSCLPFLLFLLFSKSTTLDISNSICTPNPIPTTLSFFMGRKHWGHNHVRSIRNTRNRRNPSFLFSFGSIQFRLANECQGHWHQAHNRASLRTYSRACKRARDLKGTNGWIGRRPNWRSD